MDGRTSALALVEQVANSSDSVRARAASTVDQPFIVVEEDIGRFLTVVMLGAL